MVSMGLLQRERGEGVNHVNMGVGEKHQVPGVWQSPMCAHKMVMSITAKDSKNTFSSVGDLLNNQRMATNGILFGYTKEQGKYEMKWKDLQDVLVS